MTKEKKLTPGLPSGFEDRWNKKLSVKKKLIEIIENNFLKYGFSPLETPSFEISKNIGSFLADDEDNSMSDVFTFNDVNEKITLRYDLSSPLSRFVAQNYRDLTFPYKRYAIGNVWRNEKAGNARYREFTQADCDIVGNFNQGQANAELIMFTIDTLLDCGLKKNQFSINISNRKLIQGLFNKLNIDEKSKKLKAIRAIDKLNKFGLEGVENLLKKGRKDSSGAFTKGAELNDQQVSKIMEFLNVQIGIFKRKRSTELSDLGKELALDAKDFEKLNKIFDNPLSEEGANEIDEILECLPDKYKGFSRANYSIVRGLDYYDGFILETNLDLKLKNNQNKEIDIGSICSGGQYGKLISRFKGVDFPGTGVSIGVDRLAFALNQINSIKIENNEPVLICILDIKYLKKYYETLDYLRENGISSELYLDSSKNLKKQLTYADKKGCPVVIIVGDSEIKENKFTLKNLKSSKENDQKTVSKESLINEIKKII